MRYKSCRLLEHGIYIYHDPGTQHIIAGHCCNTDHLNFKDRLYLYFDLVHEKFDWNYVFEQKSILRNNAKKGIYPTQCDGCFELVERDWDEENYINHITAGHIMKCNSRCIYCPTGRISDWHNREQEFDLKPFIAELLNKNLLRYNGSLRFVGGEPTLISEFDWLVELFSKNNVPEIYVPTSGIRLSKTLCSAIQKVDSAAIVISIDSGCEKTFEKIKGTKFYNIVWNNLKTYLDNAREKSFVIPKFILFTNYNDTSVEIENWLKKCSETGVVEVQFDSEHSVSSSEDCENKKYVNRTIKMLNFAEITAQKYNIKVTSFLAFMNRAKRIFEKQADFFNKNKNLFSDLHIESTSQELDFNKYYNDLYIDMDNIDSEYIDKNIDKLIQDSKFSPFRKAIITSKTEITKYTNFEQIIFLLLRLGFDIELTTSKIKYDSVINEILKTSNSNIKFKINKIPLLNILMKLIIKKRNYNKFQSQINFV